MIVRTLEPEAQGESSFGKKARDEIIIVVFHTDP